LRHRGSVGRRSRLYVTLSATEVRDTHHHPLVVGFYGADWLLGSHVRTPSVAQHVALIADLISDSYGARIMVIPAGATSQHKTEQPQD